MFSAHLAPIAVADLRRWVRLILLIAARVYRGLLLTFIVVALAPLAFGWGSYVVRSGSMEPAINVGDIVIAQPIPANEDPRLGRVMVFTNPARTDGELLVHRVVERRDDGTYTTAGDNNVFPDSTPAPRTAFKARAVLLAPYVGLPVVWLNQHNFLALALWFWATIAAFILAGDPDRRRRRRGKDQDKGTRDGDSRGTDTSAARTPRRGHAVARQVLTATLAGGLVLGAGGVATATFTDSTTNSGNIWTVGRTVQPYVAAVMADKPYLFYLLDEPSGQWASDYSGNQNTGRYTSIAGYQTAGALPNNTGYGVTLGSGSRIIPDGNAISSPASFTLEAWFKTTAKSVAPLIGFEATKDATSFPADRQVRLEATGQISYGAWASVSQHPLTSAAKYNDGTWHHLAVAVTGSGLTESAVLYVDGKQVASGTTSWVSSFTGWWRIGAGTVPGILSLPTAASFNGSLDNVAIYHSALSAARIAAHYNAR
ncbi:signal peptidase I [Nocardioides sp. Kera G14]|uniref:signal peptidase I n=1 Tax=Nocardioides sp. Kera G14 TaxID=2884264 RepID=UPI001D104528|nr:signal peptidase I [Nocardioides sp. Kera G14]UDY24155.1 signal peptidase I [Nocardioides sp. Kera G14]